MDHHRLIDEAEALCGSLQEQASAIEAQRRVPADLAQTLARAGVFRMLVPKTLGGEEVTPSVMVRVLEALGTGDGATAWCAMTGATTGLVAAYLAPDAAATIWNEDPTVITAGVFAPMGRAKPEAGGYRVSGRWPFTSGCDNATLRMGGGLVFESAAPRTLASGKPEIRSFLFRAEQTEIIDTWDTAGLCGTGSHDMAVQDAFVAAEHTACLLSDEPRHDGPLYRFPAFGLLAAGVAGVALGIGRAAIRAFSQLAKAKKSFGGGRTLAEQDLTQLDVARAEAELSAGRALLLECCERGFERASSGPLSLEDRARLRLAACHATRASVRAVDAMYEAGGGTALYKRSPLQRYLRDVHTITQHIMVAKSVEKTAGRVLLGLETDVDTL